MTTFTSIFGNDDRTRLDPAAANAFPASVTVRIVATWNDGYTLTGSGVLVGRNDILTAAHVVFSASRGGAAARITVQPGYDHGVSPAGEFAGIDVATFSAGGTAGDLAVVHTAEMLGDRLGWIGGAADPTDALLLTPLSGVGYPADIDGGQTRVLTAGTVDARAEGLLIFRDDMDLAGGQSGSALLSYDAGDFPSLAGVLIGSRYYQAGQQENLGIEITAGVSAWLQTATGQESLWSVNPHLGAYTIGRYYDALFDRLPDPGGLNYWVELHENGATLSQIASNFLASPEFTALHGDTSGFGNQPFVTLVYQQLLHRDPESAGLDYWQGAMQRGSSQADVLAAIAQSQEAITASTASLAGLHPLANGEWVL